MVRTLNREESICLVTAAVLVAMIAIDRPAQAQNYPWCAQYSGLGGTNCGFTTHAQCMATLAGMGGFCVRNTQYQPRGGPVQPSPWPYGYGR
jgi:Protein of unknown function (DUF3551)